MSGLVYYNGFHDQGSYNNYYGCINGVLYQKNYHYRTTHRFNTQTKLWEFSHFSPSSNQVTGKFDEDYICKNGDYVYIKSDNETLLKVNINNYLDCTQIDTACSVVLRANESTIYYAYFKGYGTDAVIIKEYNFQTETITVINDALMPNTTTTNFRWLYKEYLYIIQDKCLYRMNIENFALEIYDENFVSQYFDDSFGARIYSSSNIGHAIVDGVIYYYTKDGSIYLYDIETKLTILACEEKLDMSTNTYTFWYLKDDYIYILGSENDDSQINYVLSLPTIKLKDNTITDKIFYITNEGDGYFHGNLEVSNEETYINIKPSGDNIMEIVKQTDDDKLFYVSKNGELYIKGNIYATSINLGENAKVSGKIEAATGNIGGFTINETSISAVDTTNNTGITLNSNGDIFSYGTNQWMWLNGGNMYFGIGQAVDFTKAYSQISSNGVYVASNKSTEVGKYLFEANANYDWVAISTHTPAQSALFVYNDSNTDTANIGGMASCVTMKTDYAGFSNRPLDIMAKTGNDDGTQTYVYMNVFGEYKGAGDGSSYDTSGRLTLRSAINTGTDWIGNDSSLSNGYIPSSIGSTTFRWGQGFFHDLTITNPLKVTSDKKLKDHIGYLDSKESLEFINHLQPAEYTMTHSENKRVHRGFYAQDVSKVSNNMGFDNLSLYSAYVEKDGEISPYDANEDDENLRWSLSYDEFIAPMVSAMQELSKENNELKDKVTELEDRLEKLEKLLLEK